MIISRVFNYNMIIDYNNLTQRYFLSATMWRFLKICKKVKNVQSYALNTAAAAETTTGNTLYRDIRSPRRFCDTGEPTCA